MLDNILDALTVFHLLRPELMLFIPVVLLIWYLARQRESRPENDHLGIANHLISAMRLKQSNQDRLRVIDSGAIALILLIVAACGPTWSKMANPFQTETAPMVVVLNVNESMVETDLLPTRLTRAKFKILDLIEQRSGARTAVIAYAGTAHRLTPMTQDPAILRTMLEALSPEIMPEKGNNLKAAIEIAKAELRLSATAGSILVVTDSIETDDLVALNQNDEQSHVIVFLASANDGEFDRLRTSVKSKAIQLTTDNSDIQTIQRQANSAFEAVSLTNASLEWQDSGWLFAIPAAFFIALCFRQGRTVSWATPKTLQSMIITVGLTLSFINPAPVQAQANTSFVDYFLTSDQQGMIHYKNQDYQQAARKFDAPIWQAQSLMQLGQFEQAADMFARVNTAEAAFAEGYCWLKAERFNQSARAYERAIALRPEFTQAKDNLLVIRAMLKLFQSNRERDKGEAQGGASQSNPDVFGDLDIKSTNDESGGGQSEFSTTEEWMRAVNTDMAEFLKIRFKLEAKESKSQQTKK